MLLTEYRPFQVDKQLVEQSISENKPLTVKGIIQRAESKNQNGRVYPTGILKREVKNNKRKLKETHYLNHCQICCLATDKTFNENYLNEDFLVKSLGAINRKKLMDVHHIHSIGKDGPKTPLSNMLVLCNNHHYSFVKSDVHSTPGFGIAGGASKPSVSNIPTQFRNKRQPQD